MRRRQGEIGARRGLCESLDRSGGAHESNELGRLAIRCATRGGEWSDSRVRNRTLLMKKEKHPHVHVLFLHFCCNPNFHPFSAHVGSQPGEGTDTEEKLGSIPPDADDGTLDEAALLRLVTRRVRAAAS